MTRQAIRLAEHDRQRAIPRKLTFTVASLRAIPTPQEGRVWVYDTRCPGLALMATASGFRGYYSYKWIKSKGKPERIPLGNFNELSIEQARKLANATTIDVLSGKDPMADKRAARGAMTFGELWAYYLTSYAKPHKRDWAKDEQRYNTHLKRWASRRLEDIDRAAVTALHNRIGQNKTATPIKCKGVLRTVRRGGPGTANRALALLSTMFGVARRDLGYEGGNPVEGVRRFKENTRERFLSPDELPKLFTALNACDNLMVRDFFKICLLCGARRGNVAYMKWADVDLDAGVWVIPGDQFKNGEAQRVILPPAAVEILKARISKSPWVFPSSTSASGHIENVQKPWSQICKSAGLENLHPHDLRRTLASWMAGGGTSLLIVGKALGHRSAAATSVYARLANEPVRAAVNVAAQAIVSAAGTPAKNKGKTA